MKKKKLTNREAIRRVMMNGRWWTIPKLQRVIRIKYKLHAMETTISAKIRDLRKSEFGAWEIDREYSPNTKLYQYKLVL